MKLVGKLVAWSARTLTVRVSALNHELRYYAVKNEPVIKRNAFLRRRFGVVSLRKCYEVGYRNGSLFHFKLNEDVASACLKQGIQAVSDLDFLVIHANFRCCAAGHC